MLAQYCECRVVSFVKWTQEQHVYYPKAPQTLLVQRGPEKANSPVAGQIEATRTVDKKSSLFSGSGRPCVSGTTHNANEAQSTGEASVEQPQRSFSGRLLQVPGDAGQRILDLALCLRNLAQQ